MIDFEINDWKYTCTYVFCIAMISMSPIVNDYICDIIHNFKVYKAQDYLLTENAGSTTSTYN